MRIFERFCLGKMQPDSTPRCTFIPTAENSAFQSYIIGLGWQV